MSNIPFPLGGKWGGCRTYVCNIEIGSFSKRARFRCSSLSRATMHAHVLPDRSSYVHAASAPSSTWKLVSCLVLTLTAARTRERAVLLASSRPSN